MQTTLRKIRVFVASPGDVQAERDALAKVVSEINQTISAIAPEKGVFLELLRWQTHAHPEMGRAQGIINQQIGDYDILVGIMWRRFGSPSGAAASGTEEEFRRAYERWERERKPQILFYFSQAPSPPPRSPEDAEQLARVVSFRDELVQKGLVWEYTGHDEFADAVRPHLISVLGTMVTARGSPSEDAGTIGQLSLDSELSPARDRMLALARDYERIRAAMPSGEPRTRKMEIIVTRMRTLAKDVYPLLSELAASESAGERLAAVAVLQIAPHPDYLDWLAERFKGEGEFIAYHAAVALLRAARRIGRFFEDQVDHAITTAKTTLGSELGATDRYRALDEAHRELHRSR